MGLTVHHAAALVIAQRLCRFSERAPSGCDESGEAGVVIMAARVQEIKISIREFFEKNSLMHVAQVRATDGPARSS